LTHGDEVLVQQFKEGDESAFTFLVQKYKNLIFQFLLHKTHQWEQASDLTQEVFIKFYHSISTYKNKGKFKSWLFKIAQNIYIDFHRKESRFFMFSLHNKNPQAPDEEISFEKKLIDPLANPSNEIEQRELQQAINSIIESLPEEKQTALILCQFHRKSYAEIAAIQNCPIGTVKSRIHFSVQTIRKQLKEKGFI
jgi:RNA polymerase sigma-70 factor (ECF subfamily)